ncbi:MAG: hypothetical protein MRK00_16335 [Nitrosomonas sp.]|nr:hypothetical protein [Nitrosomonas sp.]
MGEEITLTIEIKNERPIELLDLAKSLISMSNEYRHFLAEHDPFIAADDVKLYIKEIRSGSIIAELAALSPYALPLIDHAETITEYIKHIKVWYKWLSESDKKPENINKSTLENLNNILEPIAKDNGAQMNIASLNIQGDMKINLTIGSNDANAAQNAIRRALNALKEPVTGIHQSVVMYWAQARNDPHSNKAGDRAKIESVFSGDVKVMFINDELKVKMLFDEAHPFNKAFIVDVAVETINGKPALYKIIKLHDVFDK